MVRLKIDVQPNQDQAELPSWHLMEHFVLRSPGFPFDWLTRLRFSKSVLMARRVLAAQLHKRQLQRTFEVDIFPQLCDEETAAECDKQTFRFWYRLAREIRQGRQLNPAHILAVREHHNRPELAVWLQHWQATCTDLAQLVAEGEAIFQDELAERRRVLRDLVSTSSFQEALWLSNPSVYETGCRYFERHWHPHQRPAKIKHLERRFYAYLQRFCAKNDTSSFFGPLNYGSFGDQEGVRYCRSSARIRRRQVFFAYWAAQKLVECITAEASLRPYLAPRRNPACAPLLQDRSGALYDLIDGVRSVSDLASLLNRPCADILAELEHLIEKRLVHLDLPIPPATLHPLAYLAEKLRAMPEDCPARMSWLETLAEFHQLCSRFAAADLPTRRELLAQLELRYELLTGTGARRGEGKMFQDRTLLYEECLGGVDEFCLGAEHQRQIVNALRPIAMFCTRYSELRRKSLRAAARLLLDELAPSRASIPFVQFLAAWRRRFGDLPPSLEAEALRQCLTELVAQSGSEDVCRISAATLLEQFPPPTEPVLLSPDLLLAAPSLEALAEGRYQLVVGEIHHGLQPVGWMLSLVDDPSGWQRALNACLPAPTDTQTPANLLLGRRMKTAPPEFVGPTVQCSAVSLREHQFDLGALLIERDGDELLLRMPGHPQALCFYPPSYGVPETLYAPFACFSYPLVQNVPVQCGAHTPRIEIDQVVYQRERWDFPTTLLPGRDHQGTSFQLLIDYAEFQQQHGLPDHIFVRTPAEPKPVYIDLANYFALELLAHMAGQSETITLSEMWPDPEHLWMQGDDGEYCSELRTVLCTAP